MKKQKLNNKESENFLYFLNTRLKKYQPSQRYALEQYQEKT